MSSLILPEDKKQDIDLIGMDLEVIEENKKKHQNASIPNPGRNYNHKQQKMQMLQFCSTKIKAKINNNKISTCSKDPPLQIMLLKTEKTPTHIFYLPVTPERHKTNLNEIMTE